MKGRAIAIGLLFASFVNATAQELDVISPSTFISGKAYPLVVEATVNGSIDLFRSENVSVNATGGLVVGNVLKLKKGRAMSTVQTDMSTSLSINGQDISVSSVENSNGIVENSGSISGSETWSSGSVHHIVSDLFIGPNDSLTIEPGCWILIGPNVNIWVNGFLNAFGTRSNPVTFCSNTASGWGGVIAEEGAVSFTYCLFNNGGADASLAFGHSGSQAVVSSTGGELNMDHCYIFDCLGKGIGGQNGLIQFNNGGISRCDMGGEFLSTRIQINASHVLDIPNDDGLFQDDDNDGFYFAGTHPSGGSEVDSCVFMFGKDDAIDHNGAILELRNSWVENFENEGLAASNSNSVMVYNSLFKDCEQGIEAGYGTPQVTVDHCVMVGNDNGLRFGDWYDWGCAGSIVCTNSIMVNNQDNIHNYDYLTAAPVAGAIQVNYSLTNDSEYDGNTGCLSGQPILNSHYLLEPGSIGIGLSNDGSDMGLIAPPPLGIGEGIWPRDLSNAFKIFDLQGRLVHTSTGLQSLNMATLDLINGIYVIETDSKRWKQAIFK